MGAVNNDSNNAIGNLVIINESFRLHPMFNSKDRWDRITAIQLALCSDPNIWQTPNQEVQEQLNLLEKNIKAEYSKNNFFPTIAPRWSEEGTLVELIGAIRDHAMQKHPVKFTISGNKMPSLPPGTDELTIENWEGSGFPKNLNYPKLDRLDFSFNQLRRLAPTDIKKGDLPTLKYAGLTRCILDRIPDGIASDKLFRLSLTDCQFTNNAVDFTACINLHQLDLTRTPLGSLPKSIGSLVKLNEIILTNCQLEQLPDEIGNLSKLEKLDIADNPNLTYLPESLGKLPKLKKLVCDRSHLRYLPASLANCPKLKKIMDTYGRPYYWEKDNGVSLSEFLKSQSKPEKLG